MKLRNRRPASDKVPLNMTPMIDIVFQLQAFFIMTFTITVAEGDFNIKMPLGVIEDPAQVSEIPTCLKVELKSTGDGSLAGVTLGDRQLASVRELRGEVQGLVLGPSGRADEFEVELSCDYRLNYEHVIDTITAITGYRDRQGSIVKLIDKVKFAAPKPDKAG